MSDTHYVEIVEIATGKVEKCMGPMPEAKADTVERGVVRRIDDERFFVRTGTREELDREAAERTRADVSAELGVIPGLDGQSLAVLVVAAHEAPIGPERAAALHAELAPIARRDAKTEIIEDAAAEVLAAALEYAAAPRSAPRLRRLRSVASKYGTLRGVTKKGAARGRHKA